MCVRRQRGLSGKSDATYVEKICLVSYCRCKSETEGLEQSLFVFVYRDASSPNKIGDET